MKIMVSKIILFVALLVGCSNLYAQTEPESSILVMESQDGQHSHKVAIGQRVNYQVKGGSMQKKGKLESVSENEMVVGGKTVPFDSLEVLVHRKGNQKPAGVGLTVGALVALPISFLLWIVSLLFLLDNPSQAQRVIIGVLTAFTLFIFPLLIILGVILIAIGSRRFDLRKGWKAKAVKIVNHR